jgi:hypothetical protein
MRKAKTVAADELRSEYECSDFGPLVRWKYIERLRTSFQRRRDRAGPQL